MHPLIPHININMDCSSSITILLPYIRVSISSGVRVSRVPGSIRFVAVRPETLIAAMRIVYIAWDMLVGSVTLITETETDGIEDHEEVLCLEITEAIEN